ncbi:hypothetical protein LINGRAHAP2_LOCUS14959, partial [Linum grandiflorum]
SIVTSSLSHLSKSENLSSKTANDSAARGRTIRLPEIAKLNGRFPGLSPADLSAASEGSKGKTLVNREIQQLSNERRKGKHIQIIRMSDFDDIVEEFEVVVQHGGRLVIGDTGPEYVGGTAVEMTLVKDYVCFFEIVKMGTENLEYSSVERIFYLLP